MSQSAIRTAIYNVVNGVTNKGVVYDYERFSDLWDDFLGFFKTTISSVDQIRGWTIGYEGFDPGQPMEFTKSHRYMRTHRFVVRMYFGLSDADATEKTAATLAETVCTALDVDTTLCSSTYYQHTDSLARLRVFDTRLFGSVLCHYAEIEVRVTEFIT